MSHSKNVTESDKGVQARVYLSNRFSILFDHLQRNLFESEDLFTQRVLITPSRSIREWVYEKIASENSVALALSPFSLDKGCDHLLARFFTYNSAHRLPSIAQMTLMLEERIREVPFLESHLKGHEKRVIPLCQKLAALFYRYALYGMKTTLSWEKEPKSWQSVLWKQLFPLGNPCRELLLSCQPKQERSSPHAIHLFSFNHLSPFHFEFFRKVASLTPLFFYHLSPCAEFWSDLEGESAFERTVQRMGPALEAMHEEVHPFLANFGKVGRYFAARIEEELFETIEEYHPSEPTSVLATLQNDLLSLRYPEKQVGDASLQVHLFSSLYREVEGLYHLLAAEVAEGIEPKDILVMAPDIALYEPFITALFGQGELPYRMKDISLMTHSRLTTALFSLIHLETKRWGAQSLFEIFAHPLFVKREQWDLSLIKKWVAEEGIRWGFDKEHIQTILHDPLFCDDRATWQAGLHRLLSRCESDQAPLLSDLIDMVRALYLETRPLHDGTALTLEGWCDFLKHLEQRFFPCAAQEKEELFSKLSSVASLSKSMTYVFETIWPFIHDQLSGEKISLFPHKLQAIRFCSMLPMRSLPADVICLIGMNDDFPRRDRLSSLDALKGEKGADYYPSSGDLDRYLFLEALLSARKKLIVTYQGTSPIDDGALPPSPLVSELISYYIPQERVAAHPRFAFDKAYFDLSHPLLKNTSSQNYQRALSLQTITEALPFIPQFHSASKSVSLDIPKGRHVVSLQELVQFIRFPLRHYMRHTLNLHLKGPKKLKEQEEFTLLPWQLTQMKKEAFFDSSLSQKWGKQGNLPLSSFATLGMERVESEVAQAVQFLKGFGLEGRPLTLHLSPPLELHFGPQTQVMLVGEIENVYPTGLFVLDHFGWREALRYFPSFLSLCALSYCTEPPSLFFGGDGSRKEQFFDDALPFLHSLLSLYFHGSTEPLPLMPQFIESILMRDEKEFKKILEGSLEGLSGHFLGDEERFMLRSHKLLAASTVFERWGESVDLLYKGMYDAWF